MFIYFAAIFLSPRRLCRH